MVRNNNMANITEIVNMDSRAYVDQLLSRGILVDCIVSDPPYGDVVKNVWDRYASREEYLAWVYDIHRHMLDLLTPDGNLLVYTSRQTSAYLHVYLESLSVYVHRTIVWARKRSQNNTRGKTFASGYEPILWVSKSKDPYFNNIKIPPDAHLKNRKEYTVGRLSEGVSLSDVWSDIPALPHNSKEKLPHPTQKPIKLSERLLDVFAKDSVYIPFAGSGSEIKACINKGIDVFASELNEEYYNSMLQHLSIPIDTEST